MIFSHVICALESYRISHDRPGSFGDEIIIEGWFLAHGSVGEMSIEYPGQKSFPITNRNRESEGVWEHHRETFGDRAKTCRFQLVEPLAEMSLELGSARLKVTMESGEAFELPIGSDLHIPDRPGFSKAEHDLVMSFESVGDNCEFGLVQRRVGSERLSLLRYAGVGEIEALAAAIENGFEEWDRPGAIDITSHGNEWVAAIHSARLVFHTGRSVESISKEKILQEESRKLIFMAQKFIDDCEVANKIFVYRVHRDERGGPLGTRGMDQMHDAMAKHGPVKLLWVNVADEDHPDATILHVRDGLYRGFIDHLAPAWNAFDFRPQSWLKLLGSMRAIVDGGQAEAGSKTVAPAL